MFCNKLKDNYGSSAFQLPSHIHPNSMRFQRARAAYDSRHIPFEYLFSFFNSERAAKRDSFGIKLSIDQ